MAKISPVLGSMATTEPVLPAISNSPNCCKSRSIVEVRFLPAMEMVSYCPSLNGPLSIPRTLTILYLTPLFPRSSFS